MPDCCTIDVQDWDELEREISFLHETRPHHVNGAVRLLHCLTFQVALDDRLEVLRPNRRESHACAIAHTWVEVSEELNVRFVI